MVVRVPDVQAEFHFIGVAGTMVSKPEAEMRIR